MSAARGAVVRSTPLFDPMLLGVVLGLAALGLVMVGSASITIADRETGQPFYFLIRQSIFLSMGVLLAVAAFRVPLERWERMGPILVIAALLSLALLLIPGVGRTVNGSTRWLALGPFAFQISEFAKLAFVLYLAGYLVRHGEAVRTSVGGFLKPMALVSLCSLLLLAEPDFGATAVLAATALGMMFLGGVRLWLFGVLLLLTASGMAVLAISSPYRMERITGFLNPWADPFNSGFQLTQALIAFGRGEWFGVGLGAGVQKLFYLPEAHTDFLFAVLAEELGLIGVVAVIALFGLFVWRAFQVGRRALLAGSTFGGHLAFGIAIWMGLQALINMGVNMGILPTKGLTLPFLSYGGSAMLIYCLAVALLLRVDFETNRGGEHP